MDSIMQYPDKGYEVEIWRSSSQWYQSDIRHPCGQLVESLEGFGSKRNAVYWAVCKVQELGQAHHDCNDEYCDNNRYLDCFVCMDANAPLMVGA